MKLAADRVDPYSKQLPRPFQTIIPNAAAIAEATEPDQEPVSFSAKYSSKFAQLYRSLSKEIIKRSQWEATGPKDEVFALKG